MRASYWAYCFVIVGTICSAAAETKLRVEFSEQAIRERFQEAGLEAAVVVSTSSKGTPSLVTIVGTFAPSASSAAAISTAGSGTQKQAATAAFVAQWLQEHRATLGIHSAETLEVEPAPHDSLGMVYDVVRSIAGVPLRGGNMAFTVRDGEIVQLMFGAASCTPEMVASLGVGPAGTASSPTEILSEEEVEKRVRELLPGSMQQGARFVMFLESTGGKLVQKMELLAVEEAPFLIYRVHSLLIYTFDARTGDVVGQPESRLRI